MLGGVDDRHLYHNSEGFLYGIATDDIVTFVVAPLALVAAALFLAGYVPARRATRIAL